MEISHAVGGVHIVESYIKEHAGDGKRRLNVTVTYVTVEGIISVLF